MIELIQKQLEKMHSEVYRNNEFTFQKIRRDFKHAILMSLEQKSGIICVKGLEGRKPKMSTSYSSSARSEEVAVEIQICSEYLKEAYPDLFDIKFGVYFFKWLYELTEMDALRKEVEHAVEQSQGLIPNGWSLWVNVQLKITGG